MHNFTPLASLAGGVLIGLSASAMLLLDGKIAGISGILAGVLKPVKGDTLWRICFLTGLLAGGLLLKELLPRAFEFGLIRPFPLLAIAGLLVASARASAADAPAVTEYAASAGFRRARSSRRRLSSSPEPWWCIC
jgi:hypothetical protein